MAKVSPLIRAFNAGEVSPMIEGRTDLDRYPSSCRIMYNTVAAPQGPGIARSGTGLIARSYDPNKKSLLIPFAFSEDQGQSFMLEFTDGRVRFLTDVGGLLIRTPVAATGTNTSPFTFNSAALTAQGAVVGDQVVLSGFPDHYNLNGEAVRISAKTGDAYTLDWVYPAYALDTAFTVGLVYAINSPYAEGDLEQIRELQSLDIVYLFHPNVTTQKLKRKNTYDWEFEVVKFLDGPYMDVNDTGTRLAVGSTGNAIPDMTSNTVPSGYVASADSAAVGFEAWKAFDSSSNSTWWQGNGTTQVGNLTIEVPSAFICDGYTIFVGLRNSDASYLAKDYAPHTFTLSGSNDGTNYTVLDRQSAYVLYDNNKSLFFSIDNNTAYKYHRLDISSLTRNGTINPVIGRLVLRDKNASNITITASAITGINNDQGFISTDIGRLIRMKGRDNIWRALRIVTRNSSTQVVAKLESEPFSSLDSVTQWRLGHWSDTTGYPNCGTFHQDRLFLGGSNSFPDLIVGSCSQEYENMTPTDPDGKVLDTHAPVRRLNSRKLSRIKWLAEGDKGLMCGTGSKEWLITTVDGSGKNITPDNMKAIPSTSRGSADMDVIAVDNQAVYIQRGGRTAREFAYNYEADGFKSPSMSLLSNHIGAVPFKRMAYAAEPFSIIWLLRVDGSVAGLTYNRDENVVGWHRHDFNGFVESIATLPSPDGLQDSLWMVIRRTIDGQQVRYIEKLMPFWDFGSVIEDAHYVDSGLRYSGPETDVVFGMQHLEGREDIYGLADNIPVGPLTVENGSVILPLPAAEILLGIGFESLAETSGLENGAQDGTAQGKKKRINAITANVWQSYGGDIGTWNDDIQQTVWSPMEQEYPRRADQIEEIALYSGLVGPIIMQPGYEKRGSVSFRRRKDLPLPLNIIALMPQMTTQDGG